MRKLLAGLCLVLTAYAARAELAVGDPAPPLQTGQWLQGDPITAFDTNHLYVVEFWATWCGPCREAIPHLNALWQKFKDRGVIVIGQDMGEQSDAMVALFVQKMGAQMTYPIALDDKTRYSNGAMMATWMAAAGQLGIPEAFIVNQQGRLAWIGDPRDLKDAVLNDLLSGHYDLAKAAAQYADQQKLAAAKQSPNDKLFQALDQDQWDAAAAALDAVLKTASHPDHYAGIRVQILLGQKKYAEALQFAGAYSDSHPDSVLPQNDMAWYLLTAPGLKPPPFDLVQKLVTRANAASNGTNDAVLDTLARLQFVTGQTNQAIITEQTAVNVAPDRHKPLLEQILSDYLQGTLPPTR